MAALGIRGINRWEKRRRARWTAWTSSCVPFRGLCGTCSHMGWQPRRHLDDLGGRRKHRSEDIGERMRRMVFGMQGSRLAWNIAESGGVASFGGRGASPAGARGIIRAFLLPKQSAALGACRRGEENSHHMRASGREFRDCPDFKRAAGGSVQSLDGHVGDFHGIFLRQGVASAQVIE